MPVIAKRIRNYPANNARFAIEETLCKRDLEQILNSMENYFNVLTDKIVSNDRKRIYAVPRHITFYILRELGHKWLRIAAQFKYDHTTIMHGYDNIKELIDTVSKGYGNAEDAEIVNQVEKVLKQVWLDNYEDEKRLRKLDVLTTI